MHATQTKEIHITKRVLLKISPNILNKTEKRKKNLTLKLFQVFKLEHNTPEARDKTVM